MTRRLHLVSLPHTQTTSDYLSCAYTQKVVKFSKMMSARGYEVILYSGELNEAECAEHVSLMTEGLRSSWFGDGFDTVKTPLRWDPAEPYWHLHNERAIDAIRERISDDQDLLLLTGGLCQKPIADALPLMAIEWGVGYEGIFAEKCVFESHSWRHYVYGRRGILNGRFYDDVIPNFFDPDDFAEPVRQGGYLLYVGRLVQRKGPHVAAQIAERAGLPLIVCGPGLAEIVRGQGRDRMVCADGTVIDAAGVTYGGELGIAERAQMMAGAAALISPTLYLEPFGGVAVEAMLSGTPVVATDFGAFTETVITGETGYRFATLAEAADAVHQAVELDPQTVRDIAAHRYTLEPVSHLYDRYFQRLYGLWGAGWDA